MTITEPRYGGDSPVHQFTYDGRLGEIFRIFFINLLLGIATLSIYRFWGKTNMRRYIWSSMSLQGQRFEYTGTGGELFKGFLLVVAIYFVFYIALVIGGIFLGGFAQVVVQVGVPLIVIYLAFVAQYAAQHYRLTRTVWCGIRGGMTGSAWRYGLKAVCFALLNMITLTLSGPWTQMRLVEDRFNNSYFGDGQTVLHGRAGRLMASYLLGVLLLILGTGILAGAILMIMKAGGSLDILREIMTAKSEGREPDLTPNEATVFTVHLFGAILLVYIGLAFVATMAFAPYAAAFFRELAGNLGFTGLRFRSTVDAGNFMALWVGNIAVIIFTLGLGLPIAIHRSLKFFARRLEIHGTINADRLSQSTIVRPRTGEGLLEVFDPGFL